MVSMSWLGVLGIQPTCRSKSEGEEGRDLFSFFHVRAPTELPDDRYTRNITH